MTITALPTPPSRRDSPSDFEDKADALLAALPQFVTEANALASDVSSKQAASSSAAATATTKASEASASATAAAAAKTGAESAQAAAESAAASAASSYDAFDDRFLGAKASDPAVDNDGGALLIGALYWNTVVNRMKCYAGAGDGWKFEFADSADVAFQQAGTGAVARTARAKLREMVSVKDPGAVGDGATDDAAKFSGLGAYLDSVGVAECYIPGASYRLTSSVVLAQRDFRLRLDPKVAFPNSLLDMSNLTRAIGPGPNLAFDLLYKDVDSSLNGYAHVVGHSIFLRGLTTSAKTVALYANAEVAAAGHHAFGINVGTYVTEAGTGVAMEIDSHNAHASGVAYGLLIDSVGSYPSEAAIVIQNNSAPATFNYGISFNNANGTGTITPGGSAIYMNAGSAGYFINAGSASFTQAEIQLPSFVVGPTVTSANGILRIDASASATPMLSAVGSATDIAAVYKSKGIGSHFFQSGDGSTHFRVLGQNSVPDYIQVTGGNGGATMSVQGSSPNAQLVIQGKGNSGPNLLDGAGASKFRVTTTGIGFFATTPAAKQTISGSRGANAALASLLAGLAAYGLVTDSTSA